MKDDFDEYIGKVEAELRHRAFSLQDDFDALERRERRYELIRKVIRGVGYFLIGSGAYFWASRIIGLFTR